MPCWVEAEFWNLSICGKMVPFGWFLISINARWELPWIAPLRPLQLHQNHENIIRLSSLPGSARIPAGPLPKGWRQRPTALPPPRYRLLKVTYMFCWFYMILEDYDNTMISYEYIEYTQNTDDGKSSTSCTVVQLQNRSKDIKSETVVQKNVGLPY